jgi:hypothetical protein
LAANWGVGWFLMLPLGRGHRLYLVLLLSFFAEHCGGDRLILQQYPAASACVAEFEDMLALFFMSAGNRK